jgi:hypothetical protein
VVTIERPVPKVVVIPYDVHEYEEVIEYYDEPVPVIEYVDVDDHVIRRVEVPIKKYNVQT